MIWEFDFSLGIWVSMVRLGEISREKGVIMVIGSIGGFWIGVWVFDGLIVICLGCIGSWRIWEYVVDEDVWKLCILVFGYMRVVIGIFWLGDGVYFFLISFD